MAKNGKGKKSRARRPKSAFQSAPTEGSGKTQAWSVVNDLQPIRLPVNSTNGSYALIATCDCNGWSWNLQFAGANISSSPASVPFSLTQSFYAERNGQFARIAQLWNEYRIDGFSVEFQPVMGGGYVNYCPAATVIDESSALQGTDYDPDLLNQLASYKDLHLHNPYKVVKRHFNAQKWMGQTQQTAWLPTQSITETAVIRERYSTPLNGGSPLTPSLVMASTFNYSGSSFFPLTSQINAGILIFHAHYSFRLRKDLKTDPFADRTLLYEAKDGSRHVLKLEEEDLEEIFERKKALVTEEMLEKPVVTFARESSKKELTKSQLMENVMQLFSAQKAEPLRDLTKEGIEPNPGPFLVCEACDEPA